MARFATWLRTLFDYKPHGFSFCCPTAREEFWSAYEALLVVLDRWIPNQLRDRRGLVASPAIGQHAGC